jgi:microcystin-dependent protein
MASPFLGEVMLCPYDFAPYGWAFCQGQILPLAQYGSLFSLLSSYYGGDGKTTFALPNLTGRAPIAYGQGPGLSNYAIGAQGGVTTVTLTSSQVPAHSHLVNVGGPPPRGQQPSDSPVNNFFGDNELVPFYAAPASFSPYLNTATISPTTGGPLPHDNMMPYLTLNWCIALQGVFPPRT